MGNSSIYCAGSDLSAILRGDLEGWESWEAWEEGLEAGSPGRKESGEEGLEAGGPGRKDWRLGVLGGRIGG